MMRILSWCLFVTLMAGDSFRPVENIQLNFQHLSSSIGSAENPHARAEFERLQLANPKTGKVPQGIRQRELAFTQPIRSRAAVASARGQKEQLENWESIGPFNVGGRTRAVGLDVRDENTIIAGGVSGGIWKTTDGGNAWRRTSDPELRNSISTLAQDVRTGHEDIWYFGTGELVGNSARSGTFAPYRGDGIYKSTDGGESWFPLTATQDASPSRFGSQFQYAWRIITDHTAPDDQDVVLLAAYGGILRSEDGGETWQKVLGEKLFGLPEDADLNASIAPFYTDVIQTEQGDFYAYLSDLTSTQDIYPPGGVYWSADGINWKIAGSFDFSSARVYMDARDDRLYMFGHVNDLPFLYKYELEEIVNGFPIGKATNLTENLPDMEGLAELNVQSGYNLMVKIHPENEELVYIGATNLYRSTDGFATPDNIELIGGYDPEEDNGNPYPNHHPDQHDLIFYPSDANKVLSANDGGLFVTPNIQAAEVFWESLNNGYLTSQFYTVDISNDASVERISGGMQDNGSYLLAGSVPNEPWDRILGGDGGYTASERNGNYWYYSFQNAQIYRLTLDDDQELTSFARVDPEGGPTTTSSEYLFINPYVLDVRNPNIMYLAGGNSIWKNSNLAQVRSGRQTTTDTNWEIIDSTLGSTNGQISALEPTRDGKYLYYGSTSGEVFKLDLENETNESIQTTDMSEDGFVTCIATNPDEPDEVVLTFSNYGVLSVFHSEDGGSTFEQAGGNLEEFPDGTGDGPSIRWAEIVPLADGYRYFLGTSVGLYSTGALTGPSTEWVKESTGMIGKSVIRMMDYQPQTGVLVVATHGNGVYKTQVNNYKALPVASDDPGVFRLGNVYPNPFQSNVQITFTLKKSALVRADIYDMRGQIVRNIFRGPLYAGENVVSWDGKNQYDQFVRNGMYFYRIYIEDSRDYKGGRIILDR